MIVSTELHFWYTIFVQIEKYLSKHNAGSSAEQKYYSKGK